MSELPLPLCPGRKTRAEVGEASRAKKPQRGEKSHGDRERRTKDGPRSSTAKRAERRANHIHTLTHTHIGGR